MERAEFERMSTDDLWTLRLQISDVLQQKIQQEKLRLQERLRRLQTPVSGRGRTRRYPQNTAILISRQRLGPVAASSRAGWLRN